MIRTTLPAEAVAAAAAGSEAFMSWAGTAVAVGGPSLTFILAALMAAKIAMPTATTTSARTNRHFMPLTREREVGLAAVPAESAVAIGLS